MTRDVRALNRAQKLNLIKLTMLALQAKLYYLQENYNTYHENYSNEAMQLYNASFRFDSAVNNLVQSEGMDRLDDNGLTAMAELSLQVSELYKLGVRTPDDQKEYEATIKQFKEDVYTEALKRLEANKTETGVYENKLISEIGNKDGKNLKGVYEYFDIQKQMTENENKISYAEMTGNNQDYTIYCAKQKEFKRRKEILRQDTPLIAHIYSEETLEKDIRNLCNKIRKAQGKVEKLLNKGKYPIWELNPVIAYIFETNEFYTPDKQEYIFDWIKEHERIDQLIDVFKNAIPIALSVMCFFMPGGVSIAMLILQGANAVAGAAAAYDDIQDAGAVRNMAYSQYPVSEEAQKIIDNADLSAIERNYAMAILSGAFTMLDFAECVKIARKLGIGDEVMKYFVQGRKFHLSVDETEELVRKAGLFQHNFKNIPKSNGKWSGVAGNSKWIPDDDFIPINPKTNPDNLSWKQIKNKYNVFDISFTNGEPDFSKVSKGNVTITNFTETRRTNFMQADIELSKKKNCSWKDVQKWREVHKYTWHECSDCKTLMKVPTELHGNIVHAGGISVKVNTN